MSGWSVDRRDQVRTTFLSFAWFNASILTIRCPSMKGPFFVDLAIYLLNNLRDRNFLIPVPCAYFFFQRLTMNASVRLLLRVLKPRVGWPQGVTGWRPPEVLPSPPPCG